MESLGVHPLLRIMVNQDENTGETEGESQSQPIARSEELYPIERLGSKFQVWLSTTYTDWDTRHHALGRIPIFVSVTRSTSGQSSHRYDNYESYDNYQ